MPTYEIAVESVFSASHAIQLHDGSLEPLHGHNWNVTAAIRAPKLDPMGLVCDFHTLQAALQEVCSLLNNTHLNENPLILRAGVNPTAEQIAALIAAQLIQRLGRACGLDRVSVSEAPGCTAAWLAD